MPHRNRVFAVLTLGFVLLGMPVTAMGVAWPSVAADMGRAIGELGVITLCFGTGYTISTLASGRLAARAATGRILITVAAVAGIGLAAVAASPSWIVLLAAMTTIGITGGVIDAVTNTYVAIRRGPRAMGLIHTGFGIGTIAGPLFVTVLVATGASWRLAFAALAVAQLVSLAALFSFARRVDIRDEEDEDTGGAPLRSPVLLWSILVFLLYAGVASGAGAWGFSFLTKERGVSGAVAGLAVSGYWAGFTASRIVLTSIGHRLTANQILSFSGAATVVGLVVFWWSPVQNVGLVALVFTGFAHGPVFPLEVLLTPRRFGARQTAAVVGFEIAAANVGGAVIPAAIGLFVGLGGLAVVPPVLLVISLAMWGAIGKLRTVSDESERTRVPTSPSTA